MTVRTRDTDDGVWIEVAAEGSAAVSVISGDEEVIYLPSDGSDTTYYVESSRTQQTKEGFKVFHPGTVESVELLESRA